MWYIYTIICVVNISIQPFCSYGGKLPVNFTNFKTCDNAIDVIVEKIDEDLKEKNISVMMKCINNEQTNT